MCVCVYVRVGDHAPYTNKVDSIRPQDSFTSNAMSTQDL